MAIFLLCLINSQHIQYLFCFTWTLMLSLHAFLVFTSGPQTYKYWFWTWKDTINNLILPWTARLALLLVSTWSSLQLTWIWSPSYRLFILTTNMPLHPLECVLMCCQYRADKTPLPCPPHRSLSVSPPPNLCYHSRAKPGGHEHFFSCPHGKRNLPPAG